MQTILLLISILSNSFFMGTVTNSNYAQSLINQEGYYFETSLYSLDLQDNDLILVAPDNNVFHITPSSDIFLGIADNSHYINSLTDTDNYYIEEDLPINPGDLILIVEGSIYNMSTIQSEINIKN